MASLNAIVPYLITPRGKSGSYSPTRVTLTVTDGNSIVQKNCIRLFCTAADSDV